jgi:hypothetical protein
MLGGAEFEERSFVAKGAPLDDGQKRTGEGDALSQSRIAKSRSFAAFRMTDLFYWRMRERCSPTRNVRL